MAKPEPYIVVPNWNGKELLGECLDSLLAQSLKAHIILVDNGSTDGSQVFVRSRYPSVQVIELDKNYGFAGGVNVGITEALKADAEFVALFNNDAVADKEWLKQLTKAARQQPKAGIVTGKLLLIDKQHLDSTGDFYSIWGVPWPRGRNQLDTDQYDSLRQVFGASGGASLYRTKLLAEIGLFDEDFFAYFEDVDLSFRAQLAGWQVYYAPLARAYHHRGATSSKLGSFARYHSVKNFLLLYAKNMPTKLYLKYLPLFVIQYSRWLMSSLLRGQLPTFLKGSLAALRLYPKTRRKRQRVQASRKVSLAHLDQLLYHHRPPQPPQLEEA